MSQEIDSTHDPRLTSWIDSANNRGTDFPLQNLPYGVFKKRGDTRDSIGVAIGDYVLDLARAIDDDLINVDAKTSEAGHAERLNMLMELDRSQVQQVRKELSALLSIENKTRREAVKNVLIPLSEVELQVPVAIGDYTDFYASIFHATNVGSIMRPNNPLMPNYKHMPIGYHGRASTIVTSGAPVIRPSGQIKNDLQELPRFGPCTELDYELEVGFFTGRGNEMGHPVKIDNAEEHIFGVCILNDWSARDIQRWEYQPLGPFLGKSFATTISPWMVTMDALAPFRVPAFKRSADDPPVLDYLISKRDQESGGLALTLEVFILTDKMREAGTAPLLLSRGNFRDMYWSIAQLLAHHTSNGCKLCPGDLLASGTVSGPEKSSRGCLLEFTWRGKEPVELADGEVRKFLEDGDEIIMRGFCEREGFARIGFGECRGKIVAAI
ncbi:MAG: fumarylacetoacetase [Pyrinomonadaceae bacterium]